MGALLTKPKAALAAVRTTLSIGINGVEHAYRYFRLPNSDAATKSDGVLHLTMFDQCVEMARSLGNGALPFVFHKGENQRMQAYLRSTDFLLHQDGERHAHLRGLVQKQLQDVHESRGEHASLPQFEGDKGHLQRQAIMSVHGAISTMPLSEQDAQKVLDCRNTIGQAAVLPFSTQRMLRSVEKLAQKVEPKVGSYSNLHMLWFNMAPIVPISLLTIEYCKQHNLSKEDVEDALHETMRLHPPVPHVSYRQGESVCAVNLASALMDEKQFPEPTLFKLRRPGVRSLNFFAASESRGCPGVRIAMQIMEKIVCDLHFSSTPQADVPVNQAV